MIDFILKLTGNWCDPSEALPVPTKKKAKSKQTVIPNNISFDAKGKPFETTHRKDGFDSEVVTIGKTASRTKGDDIVLSKDTTLNPEKYFRLKVFWAKDISAMLASKTIKERGYGQRTCDKYWAAFSESQKLDIQRGGVAVSPIVF